MSQVFPGEDGDIRDVVEPELFDRGQGWTLPQRGNALPIVDEDWARAARELNCEEAAVRAVGAVESHAGPFTAAGLPTIRFESHHFNRLSHRRFHAAHPDLTAAYGSAGYRRTVARDQWVVLREAFALDREAAVQAASWGQFQVMGFNYRICGWTQVRQFVDSMYYSAGQHVRAFVGYCRSTGAGRALRSRDWTAFALAYNGPNFRDNNYATRAENNYRRFRR